MNAGGCFCGAVRYEVRAGLGPVTFCHCSKCRKWHGHFGAYAAAPRPGFKLTESRGLKWHRVSDVVQRGFCQECGSSLFFDEHGDPHVSICVGTLDEPTHLKARAHIFVGSKGDYYELNDALPKLETYS